MGVSKKIRGNIHPKIAGFLLKEHPRDGPLAFGVAERWGVFVFRIAEVTSRAALTKPLEPRAGKGSLKGKYRAL